MIDKILVWLLRVPASLFSFVHRGESHSLVAAILLVVTNAVPVLGVAFLNWDPTYILVLYWAESVIIGFFNVLMMTTSGLAEQHRTLGSGQLLGKLPLSGLFILHYGLFMAVHGLFIRVLFMKGRGPFLVEILSPHGYLPALGVVFASQLYYFMAYFVGQRWYMHKKPEDLMFRPYVRVFVMQVTIILGAFVMAGTGWRLGPVVVWVAAKTAADVFTFGRAVRYQGSSNR